ncbi:MAG: hypothetical protein JW969_14870 [Spirochaetales bacterium]|nr:hypothetical protein [Spirochaetales bacterium]
MNIKKRMGLATAGFILLSLLLFSCVSRQKQPMEMHIIAEELPQRIDPDDPAIQYCGRIDFSNPRQPRFSLPGISIKTGFEGTGIDISMNNSTSNNYFNVIIDGKEPSFIHALKGEKTYALARNLSDGVHAIEIFKRTESGQGKTDFLGFNIEEGKKLTAPEPLPGRKIEFIGDSITCGYGNELSVPDAGKFPFTPRNENVYMAFGSIAARALNAQYLIFAYSGRGVFRNYGGDERNTIPEMYSRILPDDSSSPEWDFSSYAPDVVVINLGTNDYNSQLSVKDLTREKFDAVFRKHFVEFIKRVRGNYGEDTQIIISIGPMLSDEWPAGLDCLTRIRKIVSSIVAEMKDAGDSNIHSLPFETQTGPFGEDFHPTIARHEIMAKTLVAEIREITGW